MPALEAVHGATGAKEGLFGSNILKHVDDGGRVCEGGIVVLRRDASVAAVEEKSDCICYGFGASIAARNFPYMCIAFCLQEQDISGQSAHTDDEVDAANGSKKNARKGEKAGVEIVELAQGLTT